MRATSFNAWIGANALRLMQILSISAPLDEDAFQDAYLSLATSCLTPEAESVFEKAFVMAYRKLSRESTSEDFSTCHPDDLFFTLLPAGEAPEDGAEKYVPKKLIEAIKRYIRHAFPHGEVVAWEMSLAGASLRDISDATGLTRRETIKLRYSIAANTLNAFAQQIRRYGYETT